MKKNSGRIILHVSEVDISESTGMGRVEFHWKKAFQRMGFEFIHIGPAETGPIRHKSEFPSKAFEYFRSLNVDPFAIIVHEPAARRFLSTGLPVFVESHGIERRQWKMQLGQTIPGTVKPSGKTRLLFPLWRLRGCDAGMKKAYRLLLINSEDRDFAIKYYRRNETDVFLFRNGVNGGTVIPESGSGQETFQVLFNGNWIPRKGVYTLVDAAKILRAKGYDINYLLIGTGKENADMLKEWPKELHGSIQNVNRFQPEDEAGYLSRSSLFVLPSYFEGQPLSLLQAMSAGICCISTNCCGQKDIIQNGETGLLFEPGDSRKLAEAIEKCYLNKDFRRNMAEKGRISVSGRDWDTVSDELAGYVIKEAENYLKR